MFRSVSLLRWCRRSFGTSPPSTNGAPPAQLRCTVFNKEGRMILHNKDIERTTFMKRHNLAVRDFRKLLRPSLVPELATRDTCILANFLNIRALIKSDVVVIFDPNHSGGSMRPNNESLAQSEFYLDLQARLRDDNQLPYEFRAIEAILMNVVTNLTTELKVHDTVLLNVIRSLEESIDRIKLRYLLIESKKITQFHRKARLIRDLLEEKLDNDDDLNDLYLTSKCKGIVHEGNDHTEVEMLLEHYFRVSDEIMQKAASLRHQVRTSEEIINVILDSNRNELMMLGLKYSTGLLSLAAALWIGALYGMNLENFIEELDGWFEIVVTGGCAALMGVLIFSIRRLRRVGRIKLGNSGK
ncbi:mitochondrial inner membrane magnesium transporter Mfm1p [Diutina catenulata]